MPDELEPEEWALAIVIGFESGKGLSTEGMKELAQRISKDEVFRAKLRKILIEEGYGPEFGLT